MKSFSKFQYQNSQQLDELVGTRMGQLARGAMNAAQNIGRKTNQTLTNNSQQFRQGQTAGVGTPNATKYKKGGALVSKRQDQNPLRPVQLQQKALPPARAQNNPQVVSTGIKSVMNRNKLKAKKALSTERGQDVTRAAVGAIKGATSFKQDKERVDTGAGGMGTALRQMSNVGKAAMQGALASGKGQKIFGKNKKGDIKSTLGDRLASKIKRRAQKSVGLTPTTPKPAGRTRGGRSITTGAGDQAISDRQVKRKEDKITSSAARSAPRSSIDPKPRKQTSNVTGKSPQGSVDSASMRQFGKQQDSKTTEKQIKTAQKTPTSEPKNDPDYKANKPPTEKERSYVQDILNRAQQRGKKLGKDVDDMQDKLGKGTDIQKTNKPQSQKSLTGDSIQKYKGGNDDNVIDMKQGKDGVFSAVQNAKEKRDNNTGSVVKAANAKNKNQKALPPASSKKNNDQKALPPAGVDRSTTGETKKVETKPKLKRPNIRSYKGDVEGYRKAQAEYNAQSPENKTKVGNQGRPKKNSMKAIRNKIERQTPEEAEAFQQKMFGNKGAERATKKQIYKLRQKDSQKKQINKERPATRGEARRAINNALRGSKTGAGEKDAKKTNEEVELSEINAIAIRKKLANAGVQTKARSYAQMQKDKAREQAIKKIANESMSNWREEFIWETDKKSPDKVKEIKPMSGKNTITINPEDETSKYKRGY